MLGSSSRCGDHQSVPTNSRETIRSGFANRFITYWYVCRNRKGCQGW